MGLLEYLRNNGWMDCKTEEVDLIYTNEDAKKLVRGARFGTGMGIGTRFGLAVMAIDRLCRKK